MIKKATKIFVNAILSPFGYKIDRGELDGKAEGFPGYLDEAIKLGMDVNDYEEQKLGWDEALPILEQTTFPYLREDSVVCEIGGGTGRWSRHIIKRIANGELHLVDHSLWMVEFLKKYFTSNPRIYVHLCDSLSLPFKKDEWVDMIFSAGTFIEFKLGLFLLYGKEFYRVLKPGGYCIIEYIDISSSEGWDHFIKHSSDYGGACYEYHTRETIEKAFNYIGFKIKKNIQIGTSIFLIAKKPEKYFIS